MMPEGALLFLGAGASKLFGPPTMPEYPDLFRSFLETRNSHLVQVYDALRGVLKFFPEGNDLEALYSILQDLRTPHDNILNPAIAYQLSIARSLPPEDFVDILGSSALGEATDLLALLDEFILKSCEIKDEKTLLTSFGELFQVLGGTWWRKHDGGKSSTNAYHRTVTCRSNPPGWLPEIPVVTTNYDLAVERFLRYRQAEVVDGFLRGPGRRLLLYPGVLRQTPATPSIKLIKLHGSIDWKRTDDGSVTQSEERAGAMTRGWERISGEAMVFPTRNKASFSWPFFDLMSVFSDLLFETEFWLVIGYSFRDEVLRRRFLDALGEQRFIILLGPHASDLATKLRKEVTPATPPDHILAIEANFGTPAAMSLLEGLISEGI
jgi:hypothetical protein